MAPLKDIRVKEPQFGRVRTPQVLMSRNTKDYQKGDILDANATIEAAKGILADIGVSTDEHITINVKAEDNKSVAGKTINVYLNGSPTATGYTISKTGQIEVIVTKGATYKIEFPAIDGYTTPTTIENTASSGNRIIDAVYYAKDIRTEHVKITLTKHDLNGDTTSFANAEVTITINKVATKYYTNNEGVIELDIDYGTSYAVQAPTVVDYYIYNNRYNTTYTANTINRNLKFNYYLYKTGLYIVSNTGGEYTLEEWKAGGYDNSTAVLIKLTNENLALADNIICLRISDMQKSANVSKQWCTEQVQFNSISLNGNSTSDFLYYKGKESSQYIMAEAEEKGRSVPAFVWANSQSVEIGGKTYHGYVGSVGQWVTLWANVDAVDDILQELKRDSTYLLSTTSSTWKWTSTQYTAGGAWGFTAAPNYGNFKSNSNLVVPFFAY